MSELRSEAESGQMSETSDSRPEVVALAHYWPLFGLRLSTPRLMLSPLTDADLVDLLQVVLGESTLPIRCPSIFPGPRSRVRS